MRTLSRFLLKLARRLFKLSLWFALGSLAVVVLLRWLPPPGSMLMVERKIESWIDGEPIDLQRSWRSWDELSDQLKIAVIAAEDQKFSSHHGFDLQAIQQAMAHNERSGRLRGASTISQQVAKNLFLWSGRSWARKGLEAWFTLLIEACWPKERILEVYLNTAEWDAGVFGAEAAAQHHFAVSAKQLSARQASLLAAVLPNPRHWSAEHPSGYVRQRAAWIRQQMEQLGVQAYLKSLQPAEPNNPGR